MFPVPSRIATQCSKLLKICNIQNRNHHQNLHNLFTDLLSFVFHFLLMGTYILQICNLRIIFVLNHPGIPLNLPSLWQGCPLLIFCIAYFQLDLLPHFCHIIFVYSSLSRLCKCVGMCPPYGGQKKTLGVFSGTIQLFRIEGLSRARNSWSGLACLSREPQRSTFICIPSTEITSMCTMFVCYLFLY